MKRTLFAAVIIAFVAVVFTLNYNYVKTGDDWVYSLTSINMSDANIGHINSVGDAFNIAFNVERLRPVVHFLTRVFCSVLNPVWPYANTMVMALLIMLIWRVATGSFKIKDTARFSVLVFLSLLTLVFGGTCGNIVGSCNYLWTAAATVMLLLIIDKVKCERVRWWHLVFLSVFSFVCGWMQESFALPMLFAMFGSLIIQRQFKPKLLVVYLCYFLGACLLVYAAGGARLEREGTSIPSIVAMCKSAFKFACVIISSWFILCHFFRTSQKKDFVRNNLFELLIVLGSFGMTVAIGWHGERAVMAASVAGAIIVVRECRPGNKCVLACNLLSFALSCVILWISPIVKRRAIVYADMYAHSADGVTENQIVHFPFDRYFWEDRPGWNPNPHIWMHGKGISAYFFGNDQVRPFGLCPGLFRRLYLQDQICLPRNKLSTAVDAYTVFDVDAIVLPIKEGDDFDYTMSRCKVDYDLPTGLFAKLKLKWYQWHLGEAPHPSHPVVLKAKNGRRYVLVSKKRGCEKYIRNITFTHTDEVW